MLNNLSAPLPSGGYVTVTLQFKNAGPVTLQVPVEPQSYYWSTYSPAPSAVPTGTPAATPGSTAAPNPTVTAERDADVTRPSQSSAETAAARRPDQLVGAAGHSIAADQAAGQPTDSNLYPSPRTVTMCRGLAGSASILARSRLMCTSSVLVSPT